MAKNILIATPHSDFGELLQLTLEENSEYHISLVDSGHLLMESANKNPFDLVILDTAINDKPIIPLAQNFQDENPQAKLVIVMPQNEANLPDLSDIQVHGFLSRPCYPSDLLKMVDDLLGHSESSEKSVNNGQKIREESSLNKEELLVSGAPLTVEDARKNIPLENGAATPGNPPIIELPPAIQPVGDSSTLINNQGETTIVGGKESVDSSDILLDQQAKDLVAEAVAPKADFSLDEEEFSRELAALTATFNQSKQKTSPPIEKVNAVAIDNPFHETPDLEPVTGESSADDSEMVSPSLEISADDSNLVSPSLESSADDLVMVSIPHEDHSPEETDLETNPILKTVEAEIINLENELIAARSTWDEIVTTEKPSIDYGRSPEGDKELAEKHTGLSARYAALAKEYLGLSEEHTVLAGEHARMAEKKNILTKQRDEKEELVGNILELLKRAISGTDVQATLVIKGLNILGYAGESSEQALLELATFLERDWDKDGKGDLVRFVHLESIDLEYLVYSTVIKNEFILGMAYDTAIPLSKMRITSTKIAKELAVPDMVNILQELARKQEETASPKVTSWSELPIGIQSEDDNLSDNSAIELGSINNDLGTQSVTLQGNQSLERHSYDTGLDETKVEVENVDPSQVSISVPEEIEEILPIISAEQGIQETPIAFELSLEDEITNLLNQEESVQNSETKPVTDGDLNRKSFILTPMDGNQEISSEDVDSKPGIIVEQMETDKNLDKEQIIDGTNGEGKIDGIVEEPQLINLETIEANFALSVKPPEQDDDADQILKNVMDQLNRQSTPENDTQEEDELPGWYQEISAANAIQGEPAFDPQANNKIVEHPGETGNVQPPSDSKPVSITTEIPSEIVREIFDQLDNEENQSETKHIIHRKIQRNNKKQNKNYERIQRI